MQQCPHGSVVVGFEANTGGAIAETNYVCQDVCTAAVQPPVAAVAPDATAACNGVGVTSLDHPGTTPPAQRIMCPTGYLVYGMSGLYSTLDSSWSGKDHKGELQTLSLKCKKFELDGWDGSGRFETIRLVEDDTISVSGITADFAWALWNQNGAYDFQCPADKPLLTGQAFTYVSDGYAKYLGGRCFSVADLTNASCCPTCTTSPTWSPTMAISAPPVSPTTVPTGGMLLCTSVVLHIDIRVIYSDIHSLLVVCANKSLVVVGTFTSL